MVGLHHSVCGRHNRILQDEDRRKADPTPDHKRATTRVAPTQKPASCTRRPPAPGCGCRCVPHSRPASRWAKVHLKSGRPACDVRVLVTECANARMKVARLRWRAPLRRHDRSTATVCASEFVNGYVKCLIRQEILLFCLPGSSELLAG